MDIRLWYSVQLRHVFIFDVTTIVWIKEIKQAMDIVLDKVIANCVL